MENTLHKIQDLHYFQSEYVMFQRQIKAEAFGVFLNMFNPF